jgi:hypothetical protein
MATGVYPTAILIPSFGNVAWPRPQITGLEAQTKWQTSGKTMSREREAIFRRHRPARPGAQYSREPMMNTNALEYWVTRFRG